ncbi:hypothetical protein TTHERM_000585029 (macronuclear) [Tetrahymena thermophila SB210]|uniref:Uncharacterized protein n=1 Tax=Tetrahymena thermophila (strain SB210) TaxID=312017 RepID=W7WZU8_TETTS|nr:hypothetical protein TTHERM_000585029 [Tetrahymena thermophila SB210]EWS72375.1 hypothetical protein TTHERM_000585029 [Tetrahymena thermophila SB210]|eukprot:XP_012655097.1 hypothetical protein TTHERM_000585029 [Tetrahymena thermophila SB210]
MIINLITKQAFQIKRDKNIEIVVIHFNLTNLKQLDHQIFNIYLKQTVNLFKKRANQFHLLLLLCHLNHKLHFKAKNNSIEGIQNFFHKLIKNLRNFQNMKIKTKQQLIKKIQMMIKQNNTKQTQLKSKIHLSKQVSQVQNTIQVNRTVINQTKLTIQIQIRIQH